MPSLSAEEYVEKKAIFEAENDPAKLLEEDLALRREGTIPKPRPTITILAPDGQNFIRVFPDEVMTQQAADKKKANNQKKYFVDGEWKEF